VLTVVATVEKKVYLSVVIMFFAQSE